LEINSFIFILHSYTPLWEIIDHRWDIDENEDAMENNDDYPTFYMKEFLR